MGRRTSVNQCSDVGICLIQLVEPLWRAAQLQKSEGGGAVRGDEVRVMDRDQTSGDL